MMSPKKRMPNEPENTTNDHALIEAHQEYLKRLQMAFDRQCDAIGDKAKKRLAELPESDEEARQQVMRDEQAELDQVLAELKRVVNEKSSAVRHKLEALEEQRNQDSLNLEAELAKI